MKKLAAILAAVMVAAFALPVSAAGVNVGGNLKGSMSYDFKKGPALNSELGLTLGVGLDSGLSITGAVQLKPLKLASTPEVDADADGKLFAKVLENMAIDSAYMEAVGPFWANGPIMTTRVGDLKLAYSPFILDTKDIDGVSISGGTFGPVAVDGFYGWANDKSAVRGARVRTEIAGAGIDASAAKIGKDDIDYAAEVVYSPMKTAMIQAIVAGQTNTKSNAIRLGGTVGLPYNVVATAGYRRTAAEFNPAFRTTDKDLDPIKGEAGVAAVTASLATNWHGVGFTVGGELLGNDNDGKMNDKRAVDFGVGTSVAGFNLVAAHEISQNLKEEAKPITNTTDLGIAMIERQVLPQVRMSASYNATMTNFSLKDTRHLAKAAVISDYELLRGIKLSGLYDTKPEEGDPGREVKVEYSAPNGIKLGYAYNDVDVNKISGSMEVSF